MQGDLPHTLWNRGSKDPNKNTVASDKVLQLQEEANRQMRARKAAKQKGESF